MKKIFIGLAVVFIIAIGLGYALRSSKEKQETTAEVHDPLGQESGVPSEKGSPDPETRKTTDESPATPLGESTPLSPSGTPSPSLSPSASPTVGGVSQAERSKSAPSKPGSPKKADEDDEFDDEGDFPVVKKTPIPTTPAGVKSAKLWWVASDLKELGTGSSFEVGNPEGSKASRWKNRAGVKVGDGVRVRSGGNATFVSGVETTTGTFPGVFICAPGARGCKNAQPTQLQMGPDVNHAEHWLSGSDRAGKSANGGSSFTVLFVASRGASVSNSLLEHQNGEAGSNKGPFLGWIGSDIVASIHGSQGAVGISAVALPNPWTGKVVPQLFTVRFDRKSAKLDLFMVTDKGSESKSLDLEKGDGPDNDEYAALAVGSKTAGNGAAAYLFEQATYSRALSDQEICTLHREWAEKYSLNPGVKLKPCN